MKKNASIIFLSCIISAIFAGCGNQTVVKEKISQTTAIANPWVNWDSIEEAESVTGFSFGLPEVIADSYNAVSIRTIFAWLGFMFVGSGILCVLGVMNM